MSKQLVDTLRAARELITDPRNWTQGWYARDGLSRDIDPEDPSATCWCALGAVQRQTRSGTGPIRLKLEAAAWALLQEVSREAYGLTAAYVNDTHGHIATLAMFDEAIKRAERL